MVTAERTENCVPASGAASPRFAATRMQCGEAFAVGISEFPAPMGEAFLN